MHRLTASLVRLSAKRRIAYGISRYLLSCGDRARGTELLKEICSREKVWACISYLAAWNDLNGKYTDEVE